MADEPCDLDQSLNVESLGKDGGILLIIDNALPDPNAYRKAAAQETFVRAGAVYPGLRAPVPYGYERAFHASISPAIASAFGAAVVGEIDSPSFSIVTVPPAQLAVNQRTPHTDANASNSLAFIHYLCDPAHGGTSFYRHRATGYERIGEERAATYNAAVARDLAERNAAGEARFVTDSDAHFERIYAGLSRYNRMLVYYGNSLHSGDILQPDKLSPSPSSGRLTVTGFLTLAQ